jgi:antitoxin HicB
MSTTADELVRHYLNLPYRIVLTRDDQDEGRPWRATIEELPGCEARAATAADAAARIPAALAEWVAKAQAAGREVPEPRGNRGHSGRLLLRMPQSLHTELADAAEREQTSLNAYINMLLVSALQAPRSELATPVAAEPAPSPDRARHQRFLAIALSANVAVVAITATIAVILLITAV